LVIQIFTIFTLLLSSLFALTLDDSIQSLVDKDIY